MPPERRDRRTTRVEWSPRQRNLRALRDPDITFRGDQPLLDLRLSVKSDRHRVVAIPRHVIEAIECYLAERDQRIGAERRNAHVCVRSGARPNQHLVDALIRRLNGIADVALSPGAATHALRYSGGMRMPPPGCPYP